MPSAPVAAKPGKGSRQQQQPVSSSPSQEVPHRMLRTASSSTQLLMQRMVQPALLLIIALAVGITLTRMQSSDPSTHNASHTDSGSILHQLSQFHKHQPAADSTSTQQHVDSAPRLPRDLSSFPPQAHNHSSLIEIPSSLLPESWTVETDIGPLAVQRVFADPLLLTLEKFLLPHECEQLITDAKKQSFERSRTTKGVVDTRTSSSVYLPDENPMRKKLMFRAALITGVPAENFECGPVIQYEVGEKFDAHWDSTRDETFGRRLTFFVPLSSQPGEDGGHTAFPLLNYRFPPINGSAVIWRNFMPDAPFDDYDRRMKHAGEPPNRGTKYAINLWIFREKYVHWTLRPRHTLPVDIALPDRAGSTTTSSYGKSASPARGSGGSGAVAVPESDLPLLAAHSTNLLVLSPTGKHMANGWMIHSDTGILRVHRVLSSETPESLLLQIPDFLSLRERQQLLWEAKQSGWTASSTTAGLNPARTSSTAWLYDTAIQETVYERIAQVAGVPASHIEANAMTRYALGQFYLPHFDSAPGSVPSVSGRRITLSIVLSAEWNEEGAALRFPSLNVTLAPRAGVATLWRNYRPGVTEQNDPAMLHAFDAPVTGEVYTLTCFVFDHPIRNEKASSASAAQTKDTQATGETKDYRVQPEAAPGATKAAD